MTTDAVWSDGPALGLLPSRSPVRRAETYEVVTVRLEAGPEAANRLAWCLTAEERRRADRFASARDGRRFMLGRTVLRRLLGSRLGVSPREIEFAYGPGGKPALADGALHFNASHAGDLYAAAFSRDGEIGIDVEAVRPLPEADDIASRHFSPREREEYAGLADRDKLLGFFNGWTRKEAMIKALGVGLSHPLEDFDVSLAPGEPARLLRVGDRPGETCGWLLHEFSPGPGFAGAVAVRAG